MAYIRIYTYVFNLLVFLLSKSEFHEGRDHPNYLFPTVSPASIQGCGIYRRCSRFFFFLRE